MKADQQLIRTVDVHDRAGNVVGSKDVVLYAGLLSQAHEEGLARVRTSILQIPTEENGRLAIIKAEVETSKGLFEAIGDACPENVDDFLAPHLIRVAETRAKARALRDAVNVGVVSFEELDGVSLDRDSSPGSGAQPASRSPRHAKPAPAPARPRGNGNGTPKAAPRSGNGSEPMSEAQRRYLFRLMAGQGYQKEAAEERLKDLFEVTALPEITKVAATKMIDELLNPPPLKEVAGMEPKRVFSVSQVNAYLGCPLKYRFQYVDKIPRPWRVAAMAFGTSVHAAVEWFHKERLAGRSPELTQVLQVFDADWYAQNVEPLVFSERESKDSLAEKGRGMLQLYTESTNGTKPVAIEEPFELDLADPETGELLDVRLRGIIDLVEEGETLVDLKTAGRTLEQGASERHLQLSTYALAFFLLHGSIPKLRLDMLLKTTKPRLERHLTTRTVEDLGWTARLIHEVAAAIQTEHFFPQPELALHRVRYFAHCQQWRGTWPLPSEQLVTVSDGEGVGESVGA